MQRVHLADQRVQLLCRREGLAALDALGYRRFGRVLFPKDLLCGAAWVAALPFVADFRHGSRAPSRPILPPFGRGMEGDA
jgi:hypothetical protein